MADLSRWLIPNLQGRPTRFVWECESNKSEPWCLNELANWPELQEVILEGYDLSNQPNWPKLPQLERLALCNCQLNQLPSDLPAEQLCSLDVSGNYLAEVDALSIAPQLTELNLARNPLRGLPRNINWPKLEVLNLSATPADLVLDIVARLPSLRLIYLKQRPLLEKWGPWPQIERLYASLEGSETLPNFQDWVSLKVLHLHVKHWQDLSNLALPTGLEELTLTHGLSLEQLPNLSNTPRLKRLNLHYLALRKLDPLLQALSLEYLSIKGCPHLISSTIKNQLPHLKQLVVS